MIRAMAGPRVPGRHIPTASALHPVFGYTIVNDVTARDRQVRRSAEGTTWYDLGRGKAFDSSAPLVRLLPGASHLPRERQGQAEAMA